MARSIKKGPFIEKKLYKRVVEMSKSGDKRMIQTYSRCSTVIPEMVGLTISVYNGKDAIEIIRSEKVDVIVTDLKLGGDVDGLAVLEEALTQSPDSMVILVTAYATIETCKEAMRRGATTTL